MDTLDAVFEGCGARAIAFAGALEAVYASGHKLRNVTGVSGGAIIALLLTAGYTAADLVRLALERARDGQCQFAQFLDCASGSEFSEELREHSDMMRVFRSVDMPMIPGAIEETFDAWLLERLLRSPFFCQIFSLVECGGIYNGRVVLRWLDERLAARQLRNPRLRDLPGTLSILVTDQTTGDGLLLNSRTAPDVPAVEAVRMSMALPFALRQLVWLPEWGVVAGRSVAGHVMIDGMFSTGSLPAPGRSCAHFVIDDATPVPGSGPAPEKTQSLRSSRRLLRTVDVMMRSRRAPEFACRLPGATYGATEFDMLPHRVVALIDAAGAATRDWLAAREA